MPEECQPPVRLRYVLHNERVWKCPWWSLHGEIQCIIGHDYMGIHGGQNDWRTVMSENITFKQLPWRAVIILLKLCNFLKGANTTHIVRVIPRRAIPMENVLVSRSSFLHNSVLIRWIQHRSNKICKRLRHLTNYWSRLLTYRSATLTITLQRFLCVSETVIISQFVQGWFHPKFVQLTQTDENLVIPKTLG